MLSNFLYFCSRNNMEHYQRWRDCVVNCSQIFCTFAVETTISASPRLPCSCELLSNFLYFCSRNNIIFHFLPLLMLWIALKFFVLLQSKQRLICSAVRSFCCELLSNFLYFCSRNNACACLICSSVVVNCSQIFCTFAVETTIVQILERSMKLWIALKFFVLLQSKQPLLALSFEEVSCELLSNFLYFCSRNNVEISCWCCT